MADQLFFGGNLALKDDLKIHNLHDSIDEMQLNSGSGAARKDAAASSEEAETDS